MVDGLGVGDAGRVVGPTLFVRPCESLEEGRSLVIASRVESASKRNFITGVPSPAAASRGYKSRQPEQPETTAFINLVLLV